MIIYFVVLIKKLLYIGVVILFNTFHVITYISKKS